MTKLTAQERFTRFKEEIVLEDMGIFLKRYHTFKKIEEDLLKEEKEKFIQP